MGKQCKDTKVYVSNVVSNNSIKVNDISFQYYVDVDDIERKTRDIAFNDILKAMKRSEMDFKIEDYDNDNNLYGYFKKLNVSGWEITRCQNIANYCAEDKKS